MNIMCVRACVCVCVCVLFTLYFMCVGSGQFTAGVWSRHQHSEL